MSSDPPQIPPDLPPLPRWAENLPPQPPVMRDPQVIRPSWPVVLGVILICLAALGIIGGLGGVFQGLVMSAMDDMMAEEMGRDPEMEEFGKTSGKFYGDMGRLVVISSVVYALLAGILLTGSIFLVQRKPKAIPWLQTWAPLKIAAAVVFGVAIGNSYSSMMSDVMGSFTTMAHSTSPTVAAAPSSSSPPAAAPASGGSAGGSSAPAATAPTSSGGGTTGSSPAVSGPGPGSGMPPGFPSSASKVFDGIGLVIGIFGGLFGSIIPVFVLIWINRERSKEEVQRWEAELEEVRT